MISAPSTLRSPTRASTRCSNATPSTSHSYVSMASISSAGTPPVALVHPSVFHLPTSASRRPSGMSDERPILPPSLGNDISLGFRMPQGEAVSLRIVEHGPPTEGHADGRLRELHAAARQLLVRLLHVVASEHHVRRRDFVRNGSVVPRPFLPRTQHESDPVGRAHLDPSFLPIRCVHDDLEPDRLGPERLGPLLVIDRDDDVAHAADHDAPLPRRPLPPFGCNRYEPAVRVSSLALP